MTVSTLCRSVVQVTVTRTAVRRELAVPKNTIPALVKNSFSVLASYISCFCSATAVMRAAPFPLPSSDGRKIA